MVDYPCLVLNQSYEPLNICRARRAINLIFSGKAEMLENGIGFIRTSNSIYPLPSVIRLCYLVKRPHPQPKLTRMEIFNRDHYTCQYCGKQSQQLTIDHVIPRHQGGKHTWENLVSACAACNRKKAGRTPEQAHMKLLKTPARPASSIYLNIPYRYLSVHKHWHKYLPQIAQ
ncbi:MAG: HNH endonuclease [Dehalococcoidales bacterium]|jgi:5-methylcytosine-specific restriction endonuclease McrA|nr:HNH endonuclease [Dehalococcoidales bacterium]